MSKSKGFSLIELLIVVAIILIIAAIAIPGLIKARISANQASAVESLRTILTAQSSYLSAFSTGYAPSLVALGGPTPAACAPGTPPTSTQFCFLDATLANATTAATGKSGYFFTYTPSAGNATFTLLAEPVSPGQTGDNYYFADQSQVVRFHTNAPATDTDPAIQ